MATSDRGLGSPNMSAKKKHEIQSAGGRASGRSSSNRGNQGNSSNLSDEDRARGGRNSHSGGGNSSSDNE